MALSRFLQDLFGGSPRRRTDSEPATTAPPAPAPTPAAVTAFDYTDKRIPDASRTPIAKVLALITDIETAAVDEESWSPHLIEIRQLSQVHLPALIKSYIDIPAAHRAEIFRKTGRSASFLLNEGLEKMADRLRTMSLSLAQGNIDAFTSEMRFIDMRYGASDLSSD
jgi:hypothetical protein